MRNKQLNWYFCSCYNCRGFISSFFLFTSALDRWIFHIVHIQICLANMALFQRCSVVFSCMCLTLNVPCLSLFAYQEFAFSSDWSQYVDLCSWKKPKVAEFCKKWWFQEGESNAVDGGSLPLESRDQMAGRHFDCTSKEYVGFPRWHTFTSIQSQDCPMLC